MSPINNEQLHFRIKETLTLLQQIDILLLKLSGSDTDLHTIETWQTKLQLISNEFKDCLKNLPPSLDSDKCNLMFKFIALNLKRLAT